jgi:hypothetical protein
MYLVCLLFVIPLGFALLQHYELSVLDRLSTCVWRGLRARIVERVATKHAGYRRNAENLTGDKEAQISFAVAANDDVIRLLGYGLLMAFAAGCLALFGISILSPASLAFGIIYLFSACRFLRAAGVASSKRIVLKEILTAEIQQHLRRSEPKNRAL